MVMLKRLLELFKRLIWLVKKKEDNMPQGLEVRDEQGKIITTVDSRISILVSKILITGTNRTYTVYSDLFLDNEVYVIAPQVPEEKTADPVTYDYVLSGNKLTITTKNIKYDAVNPFSILVGVY